MNCLKEEKRLFNPNKKCWFSQITFQNAVEVYGCKHLAL